MNFLNNIKIGQRMNIVISLFVFLIIFSMSAYNYVSSKKQIYNSVDEDLKNELADMSGYLNLELEKNQQITQLGVKLFEQYIANIGKIEIKNGEKTTFKAIDQMTNISSDVEVNVWQINGKQIQKDITHVDQIKKFGIQTATIFQRIPEGFMRISTNVTDANESS